MQLKEPQEIAEVYGWSARKVKHLDAVIKEKIERSGWHPPQYPPSPDPASKPELRRLK